MTIEESPSCVKGKGPTIEARSGLIAARRLLRNTGWDRAVTEIIGRWGDIAPDYGIPPFPIFQ